MRTILPVLLTLICFWITKEDGDGWRSVVKNNKIKFDWTTKTLDVKTVAISNLTEDCKLEIIFNLRTQSERNILSIGEFQVGLDQTGQPYELMSKIMYKNHELGFSPPIPLTMPWWTFKRDPLLGILVLFGQGYEAIFSLTNEYMVESFMFSSEDTASLYYRVTSTDKHIVDPGKHRNITAFSFPRSPKYCHVRIRNYAGKLLDKL